MTSYRQRARTATAMVERLLADVGSGLQRVAKALAWLAALAISPPAFSQLHVSFPPNTPYSLVAPGGSARFSRDFFGMHMHRSEQAGNWPDVAFGSWRLWDSYSGWLWLEPTQGNWQFSKLDGYVERARESGVSLLLPLGVTPRWASARPDEAGIYGQGTSAEPADLERWRHYVRRVATRYVGKVAAYEIQNEANTTPFWTGGLPKLVELTRIAREEIRRVDPQALLVAPSGVGLDKRIAWVRDFLAAGGAQYVDAASFHLYHSPMPPEAMVPRVIEMREQLAAAGFDSIRLWNTEAGYYIEAKPDSPQPKWQANERPYVVSAETAGQYTVRSMLLARVLGFERFYWYAWDNDKFGFIEPGSKRRRPNAHALERAITVLLRSDIKRCDRSTSGLWTCQLVMANGKTARAVWTDAGASLPVQTIALASAATVFMFDREPAHAPAQLSVQADASVRLIVE